MDWHASGVDTHTSVNQMMWDELAPLHAGSRYYDVDSFLRGRSTLERLEVEEVGEVAGKRLLHLMCHIGLDTLSWAQRGARVTGLDFSAEAIRIAQDLAERTGAPAEFVHADVMTAADHLDGGYDIVFLSKGILMWIEDIAGWAQTCSRLVRPGGTFYILDFHPLALALAPAGDGGEALVVEGGYFHEDSPVVVVKDGSYAVSEPGMKNQESREWSHSLGEVVTALIDAGIRIEFLHEFAATTWSGGAVSPDENAGRHRLPTAFSIRGVKG